MSEKNTIDLFGNIQPTAVTSDLRKKSTRSTTAAAKSTGKSSRAFRTISEVADELDVATHVLRFWESRFTSIKPMKRSGGRRYYRPEDVDLLKKIRTLLYEEGYTIKGVQAFLKRGGPTPVVEKEITPPPAPDAQVMLADTLKQLRDIRKLLDA